MPSAKEIQQSLNLQPLPIEGGYFVETYRSKSALIQQSLPSGYCGERSLSTAIYYMLTPDSFSAIHRLRGDEVYHFYLGDPVEMLVLKPDGRGETVVIGPDIGSGMRFTTRGPCRSLARFPSSSRRQICAHGDNDVTRF
jgi:predicted cupin superfamily sugar epimerase